MSALHLALVPRDGLACRDGRGWAPIGAGRGYSLDWPWPSTIAGALRTARGRLLEARQGRVLAKDDWVRLAGEVRLGRLLVLRAERGTAGWRRVWPRPRDALAFEDEAKLLRLDPRPPELATLAIDEDPAREALWRPHLEDPRKPDRSLAPWWPEPAFLAWLRGDPVERSQLGSLRLVKRLQSHVGIEAGTLTAREGILYSEDVLETIEPGARWAIGAEVELADHRDGVCGPEALGGLATLGADRRLVALEPLAAELFAAPAELLTAFRRGSAGLRLVVVSPARFAAGWLPDGFTAVGDQYRGTLSGVEGEVILRAALVDRPIAVSGWDVAEGQPKKSDRMVPPGSVYFFVRADGRPFREAEAGALWLAALGGRREEGFGRVVPGIWQVQEPSS